MFSLIGSIILPYPQTEVRSRLNDAGFIARSVPKAVVLLATLGEARWESPSPFRALPGHVKTTFRLTPQDSGRTDFVIESAVMGGSIQVEGELRFADSNGGTSVEWQARITHRAGVIKLVPMPVLVKQTEESLAEIWASLRSNWEELTRTAQQQPG